MPNLFELRRDIVEAGKRMYARGYVAANDGNISARVDSKKIIITPSGVSKGFMKPEELIVVDLDGKAGSGQSKPSSEMFMHLQVYKERPDVKSVCHAHPPYATGFAVAGIPLDKCVLPEVILTLGRIPLVEYGTPGTEELYKSLSRYVKDFDAFLLSNHGALTLGNDILGAYHKMETLEHFAHIAFISLQLGEMNILNREQVKKLTEQRADRGIQTKAECSALNEDGIGETLRPDNLPDIDSIPAAEREELRREIAELIRKKLGKSSD